jgi:hypothetical protein
VDEALRVIAERLVECSLTRGMNGIGPAVMHLVRCHQTDAGMVMVVVVQSKNRRQKLLASSMQPKLSGEGRLILQSLEVTFGERVVVAGEGSIVRSSYAKVGEQQGGGLGLHWSAASACRGDAPANHAALKMSRMT